MPEQTENKSGSKNYQLGFPLDGTSYTVRENLQDILKREMLGPSDGPNELIGTSPKTKYILGRIAPMKLVDESDEGNESSRNIYLEDDDDMEDEPGAYDSDEDDETKDAPQKRGLVIPSSMGLRFQVPHDLELFSIHCSWGTYGTEKTDEVDGKGKPIRMFRRTPHEHTVPVRLSQLKTGVTSSFPVEGTVVLRVDLYDDATLDRYLVDVALCNDKEVVGKHISMGDWIYQTELNIDADGKPVFLPVHDWNEDDSFLEENDPEVQRLNLQYRNRLEFAVGRTCSADWTISPDDERKATSVRTTWMPTAEIPQTSAQSVEGAELDMNVLADADVDALRRGLTPIAESYANWLRAQEDSISELPKHLQNTAKDAVADAKRVQKQLADGIEFLVANEEAQRCFRFMNRVMADQRVHTQVAGMSIDYDRTSLDTAEREIETKPFPHHWRVFQIAFILMQIHALSEPSYKTRSHQSLASAQLLFFPTGGGKTEAYLGLAAYAFAARRRQGIIDGAEGRLNGMEGVTVLMRYTLRLLTSQQFQRAATLVCAAELERRKHPDMWGDEPFRIGLWVGSNVTPKWVKEVDKELRDFRGNNSKRNPDALQIVNCPWCGRTLSARDLKVDMTVGRVYVHCPDQSGECPFSEGSLVPEGIPVLTTDEEIYRLVPAFVIATVDKFARLAREGMASALFGYVGRRCDRHGYVPCLDVEGKSDYESCGIKDNSKHMGKNGHPAASVHPATRLRPPDLIIQDELHLITGSLGTTVGLFEAAIDVLSTWKDSSGNTIRPMIVASSATVRNVRDQIRSLYARRTTIFPPQVLDVSDTFFSKEQVCNASTPGRRYIGLSTTGVRLSKAEIKTSEAILRGAQLLFDRSGDDSADPYMTLVGYFSTTRELAGMARFMQDDISTNIKGGKGGSLLPRRFGTSYSLNIGELTSRISSSDIVSTLNDMSIGFDQRYDSNAAWKDNLERRLHKEKPHVREGKAPYDVVLATSMLQVGVDVSRLGLMMIVGQPKNTAEYIQASSRVGRDASRPGLVVTLGNWARPRDLAHFEQFKAYHDSFYARVEPLSVTPFSVTSVDRGVEGLLVSSVRACQIVRNNGMNPERNAGLLESNEQSVETLIEKLDNRIQRASGEQEAKYAHARLANRLDAWKQFANDAKRRNQRLVYEKMPSDDGNYRALMCSAENVGNFAHGDERGFIVANSMREVQPEINILVSPDPERLSFAEPEGAPEWEMPDRRTKNDEEESDE